MTNIHDPSPVQIPISFDDPVGGGQSNDVYTRIWSCRFSADGNEIVAGGSGKLFGKAFGEALLSVLFISL